MQTNDIPSARALRWIEGPEMGKGTSKSVAAIARCHKLEDWRPEGLKFRVAMVVILVLEEQTGNEPRTSSHSLRSLLLRGILVRCGDGADQTYLWSHPSVEIRLILRWRRGKGRGYRHSISK